MTLEELESKLEGGVETQTFEVKSPCDWSAVSLAKDILAMANVQDGGVIVIGIEDGTFTRIGLNATQKATYNIDIMKDQIAPYADPNVDFKVETITDADGKDFIAITVHPFEDVPVICKKEGGTAESIHAGFIYYRNKTGRVQSGPVSNSYDMRDIITAASVKMMQKQARFGLTAQESPDLQASAIRRLNDELGGL